MKQMLSKKQREQRILAYGEMHDHVHVITGDVQFDEGGRIVVGEDSHAVLKHLIKKDWLEGREVWTGEHKDITLTPGVYEPVLQEVYDPLLKRIERVRE